MIAGIIQAEARLPGGLFCVCLCFGTINSMTQAVTCAAANRVSQNEAYLRAGWFTVLLLLVNLVSDGWTGRPSLLIHQLLILPITLIFCFALYRLVRPETAQGTSVWTPRRALLLSCAFEVSFALLYFYESHHFSRLGYRSQPRLAAVAFTAALGLLGWVAWRRRRAALVLAAALAVYVGGMILAIANFPLTYLRSDMLPVILWANGALLQGRDPYATVHVGNRIYDFPYLPGMILASTPFAALGLDLRWGSVAYVLAVAGLIVWAARPEARLPVAALTALLVLCPFLQYRHELYLAPHWFSLVLALVLLQRGRVLWAAAAFGVSMAIYQFSWILFPFFLLYVLRRSGWGRVVQAIALAALSALAMVGPFLRSATQRIANNTVGQWGHLSNHAIADPINLSFWVTYMIAPTQLLKLQAGLMIAIFLYCFLRGRCADLVDMLRWMVVALTVFIVLNVLVDGYFFLMLLVVLLVYTCVANDWWTEGVPATRTSAAG